MRCLHRPPHTVRRECLLAEIGKAEEAPSGKLLSPGRTEEAPQAKLLSLIRESGAREQHKTSIFNSMVGRKWFPLEFPTCGARAWVSFNVGALFQFKTDRIWTHTGWESGDQAPTDGSAYPVARWFEDAPALCYEAGCLVHSVRQPSVAAALFLIPMQVAVSGFCSIRPL